MLRDRLVSGIANDKWQQRLDLSFEAVQKIVLFLEAAEKGLKDLARTPKNIPYKGNSRKHSYSPRQTLPLLP